MIETATMSERELAEYCSPKELFVDDVKSWRAISTSISHKENKQLRKERRKVKVLDKELVLKEKALTEMQGRVAFIYPCREGSDLRMVNRKKRDVDGNSHRKRHD
ncbi:hypothetical protein [Vibrio parahaemolyticus]|uniref:hypothetical protein n=1 Tax=Vibrio parahaemolyticus TaxID=670 RepID=UPI0023602DC8|nr:hypothetical protein [Vibrio parahaemolyticus]